MEHEHGPYSRTFGTRAASHRIQQSGGTALSDAELLAILIGSIRVAAIHVGSLPLALRNASIGLSALVVVHLIVIRDDAKHNPPR